VTRLNAVVSVPSLVTDLHLGLIEVMVADYTSMISIQDLWDRFHLAQEQHNVDAALCFRRAIEAATRADSVSADWWRLQGEMCESVAELTA